MRFLNGKAAAIVMGAGLFAGMMSASTPAGSALLPLLPTTTSVVVHSTDGLPTSVTATVSLELVKGLLITPSGSVSFSTTNSDGEGNAFIGSAPLSRCLLGLPSLLGITQATCSATVPIVEFCYIGTVTATYSGSTDLIAKPSVGTEVVDQTACT